MNNRINIKNKKAFFDYELLERFTAGIQLTGTEIKSIRTGKVSLVDSYCRFRDNELWVKGMRISEYEQGSYLNHDPSKGRTSSATWNGSGKSDKHRPCTIINEKDQPLVIRFYRQVPA